MPWRKLKHCCRAASSQTLTCWPQRCNGAGWGAALVAVRSVQFGAMGFQRELPQRVYRLLRTFKNDLRFVEVSSINASRLTTA